jgi:magnesium transporter
MEDALNNHQRPKQEEHEGHIFIVSRMLYQKPDWEMMNEQMNLFLGKNFVITLQEKYDDLFDPVRQRIRTGKGYIRRTGSDYLAYALMDAIVDNYFPLMEKTGDQLDELEDILLTTPGRDSLVKIQNIKRKLIVFRRSVFAERDKVNDILRSNNELISPDTRVYLRDTYDHTIQAMDLVESYKEITASLMDIYLSSVSFRMNQIMKVLAVISTIFIPLTFIVGVYGMNFAEKDEVTGAVYPMNMPELYSPYGYIGVWAVMTLIVVVQLFIFYKKGWLTRQ